jgi:RNA polymerase sigma factor (TIGR02999 family)
MFASPIPQYPVLWSTIIGTGRRQYRVDMETPGEITSLLHAWAKGEPNVEDRLFELVMPDLHRIAAALMRRERPDHSLQATALLNETYCRLVMARERDWQNRRHFFAIAARAMRRLLIDHARGRPTVRFVPMEDVQEWLRITGGKIEQAIAIDSLLSRIEDSHPEWCTIVELKFFMGFSDEETAEALGMPLRTMQRQFADARRWLFEQLENPDAHR